MLLSNLDKGSTPSVALSLALPLGPGLHNVTNIFHSFLQDIVAYAAYCKVDQANRPIAGVVNFCPDHLKDGIYDEDKFIVVSLWEFIHNGELHSKPKLNIFYALSQNF